MKKILLLFVWLILPAVVVFSQPKGTLEIYTSGPNPVKLVDGQELTVEVPNGNTPVQLFLDVRNPTAVNVSALARKWSVSLVPHSSNEFCWGDYCYPPEDSIARHPVIIPANTTVKEKFDARYFAYNHEGETKITYGFYIGSETTDIIKIKVIYRFGSSGIEDQLVSEKFLTAFPDPASSKMTFRLQEPLKSAGKIVLRSLLGVTVMEIPVQSSTLDYTANVGNLKNGVYFYAIETNGRILANHKMIIHH